MATTVFDTILAKGSRAGQIPGRSREARDWFRDMAQKHGGSPSNLLRQYKNKTSGPSIGRMYHFRYNPKTKDKLPYYDTFPLIFMVGPAAGGFYGINLHYLPPHMRAVLMDALYTTASNDSLDESTQLKISYDILKRASKFNYFKPTLKHYLASQVTSTFIEIQPTHWDIALFLPTERFKKANKDTVFNDSRNKL